MTSDPAARKAALDARSGVRECWQVDPRNQSVIVLTLGDGAYRPRPTDDGFARSVVVPDLAVAIAAHFAGLA